MFIFNNSREEEKNIFFQEARQGVLPPCLWDRKNCEFKREPISQGIGYIMPIINTH